MSGGNLTINKSHATTTTTAKQIRPNAKYFYHIIKKSQI
jgi:hypothetical protein